MAKALTFIGFGEAGRAFALPGVRAFDCKTLDDTTRSGKCAHYADAGVAGIDTLAEALAGATAILSLVTAGESLSAARAAAPLLAPGALWFDMNSVAPETKRAAAQAIEAAGGRYVDVAVMSPVNPARLAVPLLISSPHAQEAEATLRAYGFTNLRTVGAATGQASAIKMIRSVMVKGLEALSAEMILAADRAGVTDEVIASLDASWPGADWRARADYALDRMLVHGLRRAEEMRESAQTLRTLGIAPRMTSGTIDWQQALGDLRLGTAPPTLPAKLSALRGATGAPLEEREP
jgi:3-hydroxyisobutyrate dehydrogenase-like beta-hydroxyacid dehydrogenase